VVATEDSVSARTDEQDWIAVIFPEDYGLAMNRVRSEAETERHPGLSPRYSIDPVRPPAYPKAMLHRLFALFALLLLVSGCAGPASKSAKPIHALIITGGCCHNYPFQTTALTNAVNQQANVVWTVINEGGDGTRGQIDLYSNPDWAKPYDVIVHNECFADTDDAAYIRAITAAHKAGKPAVVIHCAMHTYRAAKFDDWREFLGVTSRYHDHQSRYPVTIAAKDHPIMEGFPEHWTSPMDELYIIEKVWAGTNPLATGVSEKGTGVQPVIWVNNYHGTRVFGTTFGHSDDTFRDPVYLNVVTRGLLWAAGRLN
jgi:uncharacterized protein